MFRDLLVHVRPGMSGTDLSAAEGAFAVALALAGPGGIAAGARVTAVMTFRAIAMLRQIFPQGGPDVDREAARVAALAASADHTLREAAGRAGVDQTVETGEGDGAEIMEICGRTRDLTIVAQTDPRAEDGWDVPERCALGTGRPVLVVPRGSVPARVGSRILVAWNGSREAASAVHQALPFLATAEMIHVLEGRGRGSGPSITKPASVDILAHLKRHAGSVEALSTGVDETVAGTAILDAAAATDSDLIVMGAYGRPWISEWLLGGATRQVLRDMTVPVLLAH